MGVPEKYFKFLELPFLYDPIEFGQEVLHPLEKGYYSNGQPMGLYVSFPMFELAHYVILKYVVAITSATFCICGDDVVIACSEETAECLFSRYKMIIERFGGVISTSKTLRSPKAAEGIGALFLKGYPKELRIPSGRISSIEGTTHGTWLSEQIVQETPVGRAISVAWLSTKLMKSYTYNQRSLANYQFVTNNLGEWDISSLRSLLTERDRIPIVYNRFEESLFHFWRNTPKEEKVFFRWIGKDKYRSMKVDHRILSLIKDDYHVNKENI
jgi:hypothetical protein